MKVEIKKVRCANTRGVGTGHLDGVLLRASNHTRIRPFWICARHPCQLPYAPVSSRCLPTIKWSAFAFHRVNGLVKPVAE